MQRLLWIGLPLALACGGLTTSQATPPVPSDAPEAAPQADLQAPQAPETPTTWVDQAVEEALANEIMPGTSGDEDDGTRAAALRKFFEAHPEYQDPARREPLWAHACGLGTEGAHDYLTNPPPKKEEVVEVTDEDWKVFVAHSGAACTSDDWSWYTHEVSEAAAARGAVLGHGDMDTNMVIVKRNGVEVARAPLTGFGWLALRAGKPPLDIDYDPSNVEKMDEVFGPVLDPAAGKAPPSP